MKIQACETEGKAWEEAANFQTFGFHKALCKEQVPTLSENRTDVFELGA